MGKNTAILIEIEDDLTEEQAKKLKDKIAERLRDVSKLDATVSHMFYNPELGEVTIYQP